MTTSPSDNLVVLNNGAIVEFLPEITHEAEVVKRERFHQGVSLIPADEPDQYGRTVYKNSEVPVENHIASVEATIPFLIKRIEMAGTDIPLTDTWLKKLSAKDFKLLRDHVYTMIAKSSESVEEGKKNS
jgi:tyrosine-protein phosphatase YwqE